MRQLIFILTILSFFLSCKTYLPNKYGVYVCHSDSITAISPNKTFKTDNWFDKTCGIEKPGLIFDNNIDSLIIYFKNSSKDSVKLTKLRYLSGISVEGITKMRKWAKVELWIADENIAFEIIPVEKKKGMYIIKPKKRLKEGVYAFHYGILLDCIIKTDSSMNVVYDFRINK